MKLGIISDIHEDLLSLKVAMSRLEQKHCDEIICLGDTVGFSLPHHKNVYSKDANYCVELVKVNCNVVVAGNHDLNALNIVPNYNGRRAYFKEIT